MSSNMSSSCAGGEEEEELRGAFALKALDLLLPFSTDSLPIDSAKRVVSIHAVVLQDVEHAGRACGSAEGHIH